MKLQGMSIISDTLTGDEYEVAAAKRYFSDISENKIRSFDFQIKRNYLSCLRVSRDECNCTITAQLETLNASNIVREILQCFTRLDIRVYIDFFFMCHSKTRFKCT